jgi:asparagine synthase (glutamine-hydrolysing)
MCGISGITNFENKPNLKTVEAMREKIDHRGPDFKITWNNGSNCIGFVRLAIIDLTKNSNQPFATDDNKINLFYNGEIYNFKELKEAYFKNILFKSTGDGEVLIYLYEKFGIDFIKKIKGMFSIVICDERKKITYLIRDRFGIKPFYYYYDKNIKELTFCSEIQGIFENKKIKKEQNYYETYRYLKQGLVSGSEETWFKNINQVKPAHYIKFDKNGFSQIKYYSLENNVIENEHENKSKSFYFYLKSFEEKIFESFNQHTRFDVKAGVHQSGGLDSTALVAITKILKKNFDTFTFDYENKKFSEVINAKKLSESAGFLNFTSMIKDNDLESYLNKVVEIQYEPFSSLRVLSQHQLYENFKDKTKVILDGSGGDEIFGGYHYHAVAWQLDMLKEKNLKRVDERYNQITKEHETLNKKAFRDGSIKRLAESGMATEDGSEYFNIKFLNQDFLKKYNCETNIKKPFKSILKNAQYADFFYNKLPRSLRYVDRASMRFGVEARVPFLDHEFVELCFNLPNRYKMGYGQQRLMMKYLIRNTLNKNLVFQNKRTIADPQSHWLKTTLKKLVLELLHSNEMKNSELFDQKEILNFYNKFLRTKDHVNSFFLFQVVNTLLWQKNILGRS